MSTYDATTWPIGVGLPQVTGTTRDGRDVTEVGPAAWRPVFHEVADAGFTEIAPGSMTVIAERARI